MATPHQINYQAEHSQQLSLSDPRQPGEQAAPLVVPDQLRAVLKPLIGAFRCVFSCVLMAQERWRSRTRAEINQSEESLKEL